MFMPIFNQMLFLFAFIAIGFILSKGKFVPDNSEKVLSRLENYIFMPALVMGTFFENCTFENLRSAWGLLLFSCIALLVIIFLSVLSSRLLFKDKFVKKIATYGLAFSNFAFMGNAIIKSVFPDIFFEYTVFCLPIWFAIYLWGVPALLIAEDRENGQRRSFREVIKPFVNPMLIGMLIGLVIGLTQLQLPSAILSVINVSGTCMSPVAMLLTGMTVAKIDVMALVKQWRIYVVSAVKLLVFPLLYIAVVMWLPQSSIVSETALTCGICFACMPVGLNSIVVPAAYGRDTTVASGMALITHILSVGTIPLMFMLFQYLV